MLQQTVEAEARVVRSPPVEPEGELRQVRVQMLAGHDPLMGAEPPSPHERRDTVDGRHDLTGGLGNSAHDHRDVSVAELLDLGVVAVPTGVDGRARADVLKDEPEEAVGREVRDPSHADPPHRLSVRLKLDAHHHDVLVLGVSAATLFRVFFSPDEGLVHFDVSAKRF